MDHEKSIVTFGPQHLRKKAYNGWRDQKLTVYDLDAHSLSSANAEIAKDYASNGYSILLSDGTKTKIIHNNFL